MRITQTLLSLLVLFGPVLCEDDYADNEEAAAADDDDAVDEGRDNAQANQEGAAAPSWYKQDYIAKFCANTDGVDSIIWAFYYNDATSSCSFGLQATMATDVASFVKMQLEDNNLRLEAQGEEAIEIDETYLECTQGEDINGDQYYLKIGCSRTSNKWLEIIAYTDADCSVESEAVDSSGELHETGLDDSAYQISFMTCETCIDVNEYAQDESNEDDYQDQEELDQNCVCEKLWAESNFCGDKCMKLGMLDGDNVWNASDIVVLALELLAFAAMMGLIARKRNSMPGKDRLIEEATATSPGMKTTHIVGIFVGTGLIVVALAATKMVLATLAFVFIVDVITFVYFVKLTLFA